MCTKIRLFLKDSILSNRIILNATQLSYLNKHEKHHMLTTLQHVHIWVIIHKEISSKLVKFSIENSFPFFWHTKLKTVRSLSLHNDWNDPCRTKSKIVKQYPCNENYVTWMFKQSKILCLGMHTVSAHIWWAPGFPTTFSGGSAFDDGYRRRDIFCSSPASDHQSNYFSKPCIIFECFRLLHKKGQ